MRKAQLRNFADETGYPLLVLPIAIAVILFAGVRLMRGCDPDPAEVFREARRPVAGARSRGPHDWGLRPGDRRVEDGTTPDGRRWLEGQE